MSATLSELRVRVRLELREPARFRTLNTGTVAATSTGTTVTGTGTLFTTEYQVGDEIEIGGVVRTVRTVASDTSLTINKALGATASGASHYLVTRQGGWTDEEVDRALTDAGLRLQDQLRREAPLALYGSVTADVTAGVDTVSLPATLLAFEKVQYRAASTEEYRDLGRVDILHKDQGWPWFLVGGYPQQGTATKPTARPTVYTVVSASQIELNTLPEVSTTAGLRFYGTLAVTELSAETDTLSVPTSGGFDRVLVLWAAYQLLGQNEADVTRARHVAEQAEARYAAAVAPWQAGGRELGSSSILLVE
jgi:hypothetical protein